MVFKRTKPKPDDGDEAPESTTTHPLTALERRKIGRVATAAAKAACYERARELLPFDRLAWLHPAQRSKAQKLTVWLMTLDPLRKFHQSWLKGSHRNGSIRVCRPGGIVLGAAIEPHKVKAFEEFAQELALRFSATVFTDEVRELRSMAWTVTIPTLGVFEPTEDSKRTFTNKPSRTINQLLGQELVDVTQYIQTSKQVDQEAGDTADEEPPPDSQTITAMIEAANQAGYKKELNELYKQTYNESDATLTEELLDDPDRTRKHERRDRRRQVAKKVGKGAAQAAKLLAAFKGLK